MIKLIPIALLLLAAPSQASDEHKDHKPGEKHADARKKEVGPAKDEHDHEPGEKHAEDHKKEGAPAKDEHEGEEGHGEEHGEEEEASPNVGPGKGVEAFGHEGMKLSAKAAASLGFKTSPIAGNGAVKVPVSALVFFQDEVGVYRSRGGWIKLVEVELAERTKRDAIVRSKELKPGDQLVVAGAAAIRVIELDLTSGDVGHGH
ncbi:MAG: hypothetical protein SF051_05875 [Elusimicrobiota bacterium]|jgi:hypothetical protein|nr:hypothetical protein [Elusimicrobiota bacterium]